MNIGNTAATMSFADRLFTVRGALQCIFVLALIFGSGLGAATNNFYPASWNHLGGPNSSVTIDQLALLFVLGGGIVLRFARSSISVRWNPMNKAMMLLFLWFVVSYLRMVIVEGGFRIPFEFFTATLFLSYFTALVLFPPEESGLLFKFVLLGGFIKGLEACLASALLPAPDMAWSAATLWRDGFIFGMFIIAWIAVYAYRRDLAPRFFWLLSASLLFVAVAFIISIRRSFIVALPLACIPMAIGMRGTARKRLVWALVFLIAVGALAVFWMSSVRFAERLSVIGNPMDEKSASYRLFEIHSVWLTILDAPWFGYPMATPWVIHGYFPYDVLSPLQSHNMYFNYLLRGGVFGLSIFLFFALSLYRSVYVAIRDSTITEDRMIAIVLVGWITMFFIAGNTAPILTEPRGAALTGVMVALVARLYAHVHKRNRIGAMR